MRSALLVGAAPVRGTESLLAEFAEDADFIIGVDGGAAVCRGAGVRPHVVVGDMDSLGLDVAREFEADGVEVEVFPSDKDLTDLDLAVEVARSRGADRLLFTAAFSGRLDHTLAAIGTLVRCADLRPLVREPGMNAWLLDAGNRGEIALCGAGATVSLIAIGSDTVVSFAGVRWPLVRATLEPLSSFAVSNIVSADRAIVTVHSGTLLVVSERVDYVEQARECGREA